MIFRYCDEVSGEPVQMCRLARAFAVLVLIALSSDYMAHDSLRKCADPPESSLLACTIAHKLPFEAAHRLWFCDGG